MKNETMIYTDAGYLGLGKKPIYVAFVVDRGKDGINHFMDEVPEIAISSTQAEYCALAFALLHLTEVTYGRVCISNDNQTMVRQIQGLQKVHDNKSNLKALKLGVDKLWVEAIRNHNIIRMKWIPRKLNLADRYTHKGKDKPHKETKK